MDFPIIAMNVTNQNPEMNSFNYKKYSLDKIEEWIHDALSCAEASPHEIYSAIKNAIQEEYNIHKEYSQRCLGLLELLNGHRPVNLDDTLKVNKWILPVDVDGASGEYYLQLPEDLLDSLGWSEGDMLEWVDNRDGSFKLKKVGN